MSTSRKFAFAVALFSTMAFAAPSAFAQAGSGAASYPGDRNDPVSGYPCVGTVCDTISLPGTSCLCQKVNPNEQKRANLRYVCTDMRTRAQCSAQPK